jgi:tetratricopeptide (TPR) repeat protein
MRADHIQHTGSTLISPITISEGASRASVKGHYLSSGFVALVALVCACACAPHRIDTMDRESKRISVALRRGIDPTELDYSGPEHEARVKGLWRRVNEDPFACSDCFVNLSAIMIQELYFPEAIDLSELGLSIHPDTPELYLLLSLALEKRDEGHGARSIQLLGEAVRRFPEHADAHLHRAYAHHAQAEQIKAIDEFTEAIRTSTEPETLLSAHLGLLACFTETGEIDKAEEHLQAAKRIFPGIGEYLTDIAIREQVLEPTGYAERAGRSRTHPTLEKRIKKAMKAIRENEERDP